ncbi:MAG: hypothetical protein ACTSRZ_17560 [Promethearchaeota archaeon]
MRYLFSQEYGELSIVSNLLNAVVNVKMSMEIMMVNNSRLFLS